MADSAADSVFPEVDLALEMGLTALQTARIAFKSTPLFLVLGLPYGQEEAFAQSPLVGDQIFSGGSGVTVQWIGNAQGLWLNISGISALSRQQQQRADGGEGKPGGKRDEFATAFHVNYASLPEIPPSGGTKGSIPAPRTGATFGNRMQTMSGRLLPSPGQPATAQTAERLPTPQREACRARMTYFAHLLKKLRAPVCPINGVLLLLPYEWLIRPDLAVFADTIQVDMRILQRELGVKCTCITAFSGIERATDFLEYIRRQEREELTRRCGCGFPQLVHLETMDMERTHAWLVRFFESKILHLNHTRSGDPANAKLFRLLDDLRNARANFSRLLGNAFPEQVEDPFYFSGVYFAGLGDADGVPRPFFDGVISKLLREHEEMIGWSPKVLRQQHRQRAQARVLSRLALFIAFLGIVALTCTFILY